MIGTLLLALAAAAPAGAGAPRASAAPEAIEWLHDLDLALAQAGEQGKPLLAVLRCER